MRRSEHPPSGRFVPGVTRAYGHREHWDWIRKQTLFRDAVQARSEELWADSRHGVAWVELGPRQLLEHASDLHRARELVNFDPRHNKLAAVITESYRPLLFLLLVDPDARFKVAQPAGGETLHPLQQRRLQRCCLLRLSGSRLKPKRRQYLHRMLRRIDPGEPVRILVRPSDGTVAAARTGDPVAISATAAGYDRNYWGLASAAGYPVIGEVATVLADGRLEVKPFRFEREPI